MINPRELEIIQDTEFLLTKAQALSKIEKLLVEVRTELKEIVRQTTIPFPEISEFKKGKISRGENYLGLPYLVLDYPAIFSRENTFAYRTMFWWGNFFSATLHLEGETLSRYRCQLIEQFDKLLDNQIYIGVGATPWQYHYGADNYMPLTHEHKDFLASCRFLKLSKKIELKEWEKVPRFSGEYLKFLLNILRVV